MHGARRFAHVISLGITVLAPFSAQAAESPLTFVWTAPPACPQREQVLARAARLLGRELERGLDPPLTGEASVDRLPDESWRLRLALGNQSPVRIVTASSCEELGDAAALLIALSIDPNLTPNVEIAPPAAAPGPGPAPATPARSEPVAGQPRLSPSFTTDIPEARPASVPLPLRLGAALALWTGRLPGLAPGALARATIARKQLSVGADIGFFPPQHAGIRGSEAGGELWLLTAGPKLGYMFVSGVASIVPHFGLELQWLRGTGSGVEHPASAQALLLSAEVGARAGLALSPRWAAFAEGAFSVLALRPGFVLDRLGEVYRPDRLGLRFGLGAEWRAW